MCIGIAKRAKNPFKQPGIKGCAPEVEIASGSQGAESLTQLLRNQVSPAVAERLDLHSRTVRPFPAARRPVNSYAPCPSALAGLTLHSPCCSPNSSVIGETSGRKTCSSVMGRGRHEARGTSCRSLSRHHRAKGSRCLAAFWPHGDDQHCRLLRTSEWHLGRSAVNGQVADARDTVYGSEGWGFESLCSAISSRTLAH